MREGRSSFPRRWFGSLGARLAAGVLFVWFSVAAFAPFFANDKPYWMRATDTGAFEAARASLVPITKAWLELAQAGTEGSESNARLSGVPPRASAALVERTALEARLSRLRSALDPGESDALAALSRFEEAMRRPDPERRAAELEPLARATAEALTSRAPRGSVKLRAATSWPICASISALEGGIAAAWLAFVSLLFLPLRFSTRVAGALAVFVVTLCAWRPLFGGYAGPASIKQAVARGELQVESAAFPPIVMGFAETHMRDVYRRPFSSSASSARADVLEPRVDVPGQSSSAADFGDFTPRTEPPLALPFEPPIDSPWRHPLGTDSLGRDLAARLIFGARISLFVGNASAVLLTLIGVTLGLCAGWWRGWTDVLVSRVIEVVVCFPAFVLVLCAMFFVQKSSTTPLVAVAIVIGVVGWTSIARLVRAETLRLVELDFTAAARALGLSERTILFRHVLPNAVQPAIIAFAFAVGAGVLTESALSFLGFGVQVPTPSWGALVSDSRSPDRAWIWLFPGFAIFSVVASYNVLGEKLRDTLDPRHER